MEARQVVVTTSHRDVWTGMTEDDGASGIVILTSAKHVLYWDEDTQGLAGLASRGPGKASKLSGPIDRVLVRDVVTVMEASPEATGKIRSQAWGKHG